MSLLPTDESHDSLNLLLGQASPPTVHPAFTRDVVDSAHATRQENGSPTIIRILAPTLAAAAGIALTLFVTQTPRESSAIANTEDFAIEIDSEAKSTIDEIYAIDLLAAIESSSDITLVEDDVLDALLF